MFLKIGQEVLKEKRLFVSKEVMDVDIVISHFEK